jgi:hypothetical protein
MNLQDEKDSVAIIESEIPELEFYQDVTGYCFAYQLHDRE